MIFSRRSSSRIFARQIILASAVLGIVLITRGAETPYQPAEFADRNRAENVRRLTPRIDRIYREHALSNHFPGLAWGVVLDGKLVHHGAYGVSNIEKKTPVTKETLFRIASMTKSITAMAVLQLRDAGKLQLDDPAARYLPELADVQYLTKDSPAITIRDLLTHSAGFPEDNPWGDRQLADSDEDLVAVIRGGVSFSNPPGVAYEYSNLGFTLLGRLITRVSGTPFHDYIRKEILSPLKMDSSEWDYTEAPPERMALGYRWGEGGWEDEPILRHGAYGAMGGLICSLDEFANYIALHMSAWPPRNDSETGPLKRSSIREMHQPWRVSGLNPLAENERNAICPVMTAYGYGLGWTRDCRGRVTVGHSGGLPGYGSHWVLLPEHGLAVVSFANRTYASARAVNGKVVDLLLREADLAPRALPVSARLRERKEQLMKFLPDWTGAEESGIFADNFFLDQSVELRRRASREIFGKAGPIRRIGELNPQNNLRGTFVIEGERGSVVVGFTLTPENPPLIQEFTLKLD